MNAQRDPAAWPADFGQGRYEQWPDTHPTQPARLDGAHACSSITSDSDADDTPLGEGAGVLLWPMAVIAACACWALFAFLTSSPL